MALVSDGRAVWLARHVLPAEPALRAWLARRPRAGLEVDDVVQEAYAILAALDRVEHIQNPRSYFFQTAKSVILQAARRDQVVAFEALADPDDTTFADAQPSPERTVADRQELQRVARLIARLPAKCREAFTLRKVHGLSQREVAQRMGISENTVEKHIGKGLALLLGEMRRGGNERFPSSRGSESEAEAINDNARARGRY